MSELVELEKVCEDCGDDLACEGYPYCSECLEKGAADDDA